ncbi:hypothetical protein NPX13_g8328 [Xylaria arbuscula]|uniref:Uncharacterized protein n=1 Tax=Xylaria arbuscula TaxID=114810 RepID=A0A9W8TJJ0_9PEZI|nr:hypothetical protein NPX13_g8328 [Xylaria arbuscula]
MNSDPSSAVAMQPSLDTAERRRADSGATSSSTLPASPTLTNPDMILPDFPDYGDNAMSLEDLQSPLTAWKNAPAGNLGFDLSAEAFIAGPVTPTTPIIYGNGTMLSDIGEVTEVESTCGPSRSRSGSTRSELAAIMTSTALPYEAIKQRIKQSRMAHQRHMSVDSNSTVTAHDQNGLFADFDDVVSVDDSNFQGDDEDSVADSYIDDASVQETISPAKESFDPDDARYSTTLSRRAEQILANAKRRLTTMEGNLNRARSSLYSPSWSSMGSHSTPSPPVGRPATAAGHGNGAQRKISHGHNRISSESNIQAENRPIVPTHRSLSALGTAGGYRRPLQGLRSTDYARNNANGAPSNDSSHGNPTSGGKAPSYLLDRSLEPLHEGSSHEEKDATEKDTENAKPDVFLSPIDLIADKGLKRSASSTQMRDLKDQVNDLKGRLSTLRDQARADSLKRRSLQSLRTPSPFTHARVDQWYAEPNSDKEAVNLHSDSVAQITNESGSGLRDPNSSLIEAQVPLQGYEEQQPVQPVLTQESSGLVTPVATNSRPASSNSFHDAGISVAEPNGISVNELVNAEDATRFDGYPYAEADDFYESASESGASSYHDSVQAQISHEDREDAFDYEHFFLHSAMGSMSRKRLRRKESNDSFSSDGSVETTRGPTVSQPNNVAAIKTGHRSRRGSAGSTSTMESFATATEGRHTRVGLATPQEYDEEYHDEYDNEYPEHIITLPVRARTHTPDTAKRMVFSPEAGNSVSNPRHSQSSFNRRPQSSAAAFQHRPSASTVSNGTNRSFPLINRLKENRGILTPGDSPDQGLKQISETIMNETASICEKESLHDGEKAAPMQMLDKDDQVLVERLVASLGRCVLGLSEVGHASAEGREYRQRIAAACKILEKLE